jgi:hypothetical protein
VSLSFSTTVPEGAFTVTVNGNPVVVQSTERAGSSVGLLLPEGSLKASDTVNVSWQDGTVTVTAQ